MKLILENDELATSSDSLGQEERRSEGAGSWDNEETVEDTESSDTEFTGDSDDVLNDTEPDYPEEYEDPEDSDEADPSDDEDEDEDPNSEEDTTEDTEQKNTPIENPSRVLKYSEYFSN